jgi:hypothetical protein
VRVMGIPSMLDSTAADERKDSKQPEPDFDPALLEHVLVDRMDETWPAAPWDFLSRVRH